jgi:DNA-binding NtrC family response regulator
LKVDQAPASRIFVVDDEPLIGTTLAAILNMNGFSARAFSSSLQALETARADTPDLLISDVAMPRLSGVELAIRMKALYPRCKVLLFSGQAETVDLLEEARRRGHNFRLLVKPVLPTRLMAEIYTIDHEPVSQPPNKPRLGVRLMR